MLKEKGATLLAVVLCVLAAVFMPALVLFNTARADQAADCPKSADAVLISGIFQSKGNGQLCTSTSSVASFSTTDADPSGVRLIVYKNLGSVTAYITQDGTTPTPDAFMFPLVAGGGFVAHTQSRCGTVKMYSASDCQVAITY